MIRFRWKLFLFLWLLCPVGESHADYVSDMISVIQTNKSYKVRMTAMIALSRYSKPQVANVYLKLLKDPAENTAVRGMAAQLLAQMKVLYAIPVLRKLSKTSNSALKLLLQKAIETICPSSTRGKKFYLNFDGAEGSGPFHSYAKQLAIMEFAKLLSTKRPDVTFGWPRCQKPSRRMLRRKRVKGYFIHVKIQITKGGGGTKGAINLLYASFPKNSIKGMTSMEARTPTEPSRPVIAFITKSLVQSLVSSIDEFLR